MDYLGLKCPVCNKIFHVGDDIVVCPDCGTPHHRQCYEEENKCFYSDKHSESFSYDDLLNEQAQEQMPDGIVCSSCKTMNPTGTFFCRKCGNPLGTNTTKAGVYNNENGKVTINGTSFNMGNGQMAFDPMGGVSADSSIADDITAGEMAKYVKINTPYFLRVFNNIKSFSKSRFNFAAFLFSGGYFLYRKMYKIGTLLTVFYAALLVVPLIIATNGYYSSLYESLLSIANVSSTTSLSVLATIISANPAMPADQLFLLALPEIIQLFRFAFCVVLGAFANRIYYKHCVKQIKTIKSASKDTTEAESSLQIKGGVNTALGLSLFIAYMVISYLPLLFY